MGPVTEAACAQRASPCYKNAMEKDDMAQASNLPPVNSPANNGEDDSSEVARGRQTQARGPREVWDSWQVSHQFWLSTALACLPRGGDNGWEAAMCFTSGLNRIFQKLFQTLRRLHFQY